MSYFTETMGNLLHQTAFFNLTIGNLAMIVVACFFLYLAICGTVRHLRCVFPGDPDGL